ncbi:putative Proteasome component [Taphrina deformans PYCC 5710]|uniref:Proteasome component n=1 Tax=Taphrina deformans (strain PYCC 5710 / ATCC 11124 / CBS 356.35 / IMI 108563 / JCM 9778 / NBRC 8474) TaxID=1097556 RepID=R4XGG5_TAPDE|nr:putative Proteasome component [Taphrina deformans PYCC 5710]|eukprot:CCG82464.1 putative Proteasome component [Taphrina deformans PYCC 5710]
MSIFALTRQENISLSFPHFEDMVNWCSFNDAAIAAELRVDDLAPLAKAAYFHFSETCLLVNALTLTQDLHPEKEDFESRLRATFEHEEGARKALQNYVSSRSYSSFDRSFTLFQAQVLEDYKKTGDPDSGNVLLDLLLLSGNLPENLSVDDVAALKPIEVKQSSEQRDLNARLYAIISTANIRSEADILKDCHALSKRSSRTPQEELHALSLLAKILLRSQLRARNIKVDLSSPERALQDNLQVRDINLQKSSIEIVSTFGLLQCYPITARTHNTKSLIHLITRPSTDSTVVERCAIALGNVSLYYEDDSTELTEIIDTLSSDAGTVAKAEVLLAKGEALACCVGRWDSKSLRNSLDVPVDIPLLGTRSKRLLEVMENLLVNTRSAQSHQRRGACLRLISLVQLLPLTEMSAKWGNIHAAFLSLLSDTDEFISESANKGIQIVYKRCDKKTKDDLVAQLFSTMTSDAAARQSTAAISADSEIFQPGTMTVGTGTNESSISTYKDICSLAMDAGNTSLVYSFLSLASSSAMWSTRQGVALGLNSLLADSDTADDLRKSPEVLSRLLPKLFRYKHDPSAKVAKSMNAIFQQLYPDVKAALDDNFESVCSELLKSLSDQSWRVRESAGRAMATLITGRPLSLLTSRLEEIWSLSFRILDDVKESVRLAGIDLCQTLSSLIIRAVSSATSPIEASRTLDFVIPLFIKNLRSLSAEVGAFSLKTLLKITKEAGSPIKAHLPQLIDEYLQLTSTMEPEMMNYLSFHAAKYNITQNDLDTHRLNSLRASPLLEALEQCIDQLDETSVAQTVPQVCQIIRQSNGLPTKAATARFLISLVVRCSTLVKPHADTIIQALSTTLHDRNQSVVQTYASCIGYMARVASPEKLIKLVNFASAKFFTAQDENNALGLVIKAISQNANDKFISMADIFFPLCFVAMHDPEEVSAALFKGVWQDNTGSPQAIKLYLVEVLPLLESQLASPRFASKVDLGQQTDRVFGALIEALKGKSWNGKEAVLQAMVALTSRNYDRFTIDQLSEIREIMFRESRRTNMAYKSHALDSLATYLTVDRDGDSFSDTLETVEDVLDIDSCMDDTEDFTEPERQTLVQRALTCLIHACRPTSAATDAYAVVLRHCVRQVETQPWTIKVSMTTDLKDLYARIGAEPGHEWRAEDVQATWTFLASLASDRAYQSVREAASETLVVFVKSLRKVPDEPRAVMERQLDELVEGEQSTVVQAILNRVTFES